MRLRVFVSGLVLIGIGLGSVGCQKESSSVLSKETSSQGGGIQSVETFANMSVGEMKSFLIDGESIELDFDETQNASYLLLTNPLASDEEETASLTWAQDAGTSVEEDFHQLLRNTEKTFSRHGSVIMSPNHAPLNAALSADESVGEQKTFRILSTVHSTQVYKNVLTTLRYQSNDLRVYVEAEYATHITDEELGTVFENFGEIALPRERNLFGQESDINNDGHVSIVMSCVVNQMAGSGGLVTGFFFPGDYFEVYDQNPASNHQEILYTILPDPKGLCGSPISNRFTVENLLPGVLAHEWQHMVNFYNHHALHEGPSEEAWLNECLSHLAEDLTGYGNENYSRAELFLQSPTGTSITPAYSPGLAERGGCYLFLRYLYEQAADGDLFVHHLLNTSKTGIKNVEEAFEGADREFDEFGEFLNRWGLALAFSDTSMTQDPRYRYRERTRHPLTNNYLGTCIRCQAGDGRGTVLEGPRMQTQEHVSSLTVSSSGTQWILLNTPQSKVTVSKSTSKPLMGTLVRIDEKR